MSPRWAARTAVVFLSALGGPAVVAGPEPATAARIEAVVRGYAEAGHFSGCFDGSNFAPPGLEQAVGPGLETVVVVHEQVQVFRVPVSEVNPPECRASGQVEAGVDGRGYGQDLVLERVEDVLEPRRIHV
jgi:hypothetical protein